MSALREDEKSLYFTEDVSEKNDDVTEVSPSQGRLAAADPTEATATILFDESPSEKSSVKPARECVTKGEDRSPNTNDIDFETDPNTSIVVSSPQLALPVPPEAAPMPPSLAEHVPQVSLRSGSTSGSMSVTSPTKKANLVAAPRQSWNSSTSKSTHRRPLVPNDAPRPTLPTFDAPEKAAAPAPAVSDNKSHDVPIHRSALVTNSTETVAVVTPAPVRGQPAAKAKTYLAKRDVTRSTRDSCEPAIRVQESTAAVRHHVEHLRTDSLLSINSSPKKGHQQQEGSPQKSMIWVPSELRDQVEMWLAHHSATSSREKHMSSPMSRRRHDMSASPKSISSLSSQRSPIRKTGGFVPPDGMVLVADAETQTPTKVGREPVLSNAPDDYYVDGPTARASNKDGLWQRLYRQGAKDEKEDWVKQEQERQEIETKRLRLMALHGVERGKRAFEKLHPSAVLADNNDAVWKRLYSSRSRTKSHSAARTETPQRVSRTTSSSQGRRGDSGIPSTDLEVFSRLYKSGVAEIKKRTQTQSDATAKKMEKELVEIVKGKIEARVLLDRGNRCYSDEQLRKHVNDKLQKVLHDSPTGDKKKLSPADCMEPRLKTEVLSELYTRLSKKSRKQLEDEMAKRDIALMKECSFQPAVNRDWTPHRTSSSEKNHRHADPSAQSSQPVTPRDGGLYMLSPRSQDVACVQLYNSALKSRRSQTELQQRVDRERRLRLLKEKMKDDHHFKRRVELDPSLGVRFMESLGSVIG